MTYRRLSSFFILVACDRSASDQRVPPAPQVTIAFGAPQAAAAPGSECRTAVTNVFALMRRAGTAVTDAALAADLADCERAPWPAPVVRCIAQMTTLDELSGQCSKAAFGSGMELTPKRRFNSYEERQGAAPPAMTVDGDWSAVPGWAGCGVIVKIIPPATAHFVVCNDEVIAGPLTTADEITSFYAEVSKWNAYSNDLRRRIQANWPSGGNYRWVKRDAYGNVVDSY